MQCQAYARHKRVVRTWLMDVTGKMLAAFERCGRLSAAAAAHARLPASRFSASLHAPSASKPESLRGSAKKRDLAAMRSTTRFSVSCASESLLQSRYVQIRTHSSLLTKTRFTPEEQPGVHTPKFKSMHGISGIRTEFHFVKNSFPYLFHRWMNRHDLAYLRCGPDLV